MPTPMTDHQLNTAATHPNTKLIKPEQPQRPLDNHLLRWCLRGPRGNAELAERFVGCERRRAASGRRRRRMEVLRHPLSTLGPAATVHAEDTGEQMSTERTLVLVKPDGVARGLVGEVVSRIERKGLRLVALELRTLDGDTARTHYAEHVEKPFFADLVEFITSGPLVAAVVE